MADRESLVEEAYAIRAEACELASATAVDSIFDRLATEITAELADRRPVLLPVMHGGVFAATALARRFEFAYEFDYVHLSRYKGGLVGGEIDWIVRPKRSLRGRDVLVIDDILDHGTTLTALLRALAEVGVASARTAVLVAKELEQPRARPTAEFVGMQVADRYVFGCGMDYKGFWRGLPALYAVSSG